MVVSQLPAPTALEVLAELVAGDDDRTGDAAGLAEAIDRLAANGDVEELACVFAPAPGQAAPEYHVEQRDLGHLEPQRVEVFDDPVHAWQAFRVVETRSRALVSVVAELRRTVATSRPDGNLEIPPPDTYRLDGPECEAAARRWSHLALALRTATRRCSPLPGARGSGPPAVGLVKPPINQLDAAVETDVGVDTDVGGDTVPSVAGRPRQASGRTAATAVVRVTFVRSNLPKPSLRRRLQAVTDTSMKDDATSLGDHLLDLPFLGDW